jgi:hypothetical protein
MSQVHAPLSNMQVELLKLYSAGVPEEHLAGIRILVAKYLFAIARAKADKIWDEKKYTDTIINELLKQHG